MFRLRTALCVLSLFPLTCVFAEVEKRGNIKAAGVLHLERCVICFDRIAYSGIGFLNQFCHALAPSGEPIVLFLISENSYCGSLHEKL